MSCCEIEIRKMVIKHNFVSHHLDVITVSNCIFFQMCDIKKVTLFFALCCKLFP